MKRISVFILSFILIFTMAFAVSANEGVTLSGTWHMNQNVTMPSFDSPWSSLDGTSMSEHFNFGWWVRDNSLSFKYVSDSNKVIIYYSDGGTKSATVIEDGVFKISTRNEFRFGDGVQVSSNFYNWFTANAVKQGSDMECDGSTCPATDSNHDNICDDCGQILTMSLRSTLLDYAHSVIANALTIFDGAQYWLVTLGNIDSTYNIYVSASPFSYDKTNDELVGSAVVQRTKVSVESNGTFTGGTSWAAKQPNTPLDVGNPIDTSHDIDNFFPIPLWMEMETLTMGEAVEVSMEMKETMMILALLGVGLIVLFSAFPLLLRFSKTFLK